MAFLDFDTLIFHLRDFSTDTLDETFHFFFDLGIKNFIFTYEIDCERTSVPIALAKRKLLSERVRTYKPRGCRAVVIPAPLLNDHAVYDRDLSRVCLPHSDRIITSLPLFVGDASVPSQLNVLLYKRKLKPIFVSFERNLMTNSKAMLQSVSNISSAVYALDALYMTSPDGFSVAEAFLDQNLSIFPCISGSLYDYAGLWKSYQRLRNKIGHERYYSFCRHINYTKLFLLKKGNF